MKQLGILSANDWYQNNGILGQLLVKKSSTSKTCLKNQRVYLSAIKWMCSGICDHKKLHISEIECRKCMHVKWLQNHLISFDRVQKNDVKKLILD